MYYKVDKILSKQHVDQLIRVFHSLPAELAHQDYNLFDVDKRHPTKEQTYSNGFEVIDSYASDHEKTFRHYFLNYTEESFTRFHTDNDEAVGLTIVTFLEASNDLIGGEALVMLPYTKRGRPANKYRKGEPPGNRNRVIPKVVQMEVGDSLIYDKSLMHGVGQVEQGNRLVLISWYGNRL